MKETKIMSRMTEELPGTGRTGSRATENMGSEENEACPVLRGSSINTGTTINGYTLTHVIAENTGEAALFLCLKDEQRYVIKAYHKNKKPKPEILDRIRTIESPYVIRVIENGDFEERYFEILSYFPNGDLQRAGQLTPEFIKDVVVMNLNEALQALHGKDIVHRDIKPNNIFFSDNRDRVIVGDFGISSILDNNMSIRMTSGSRTLGYSAPETAEGFISKESDYYSLGVTLLHLATGRDPFEGMTDLQINTLTLMYKLEIPSAIHPRIAHLIKGLTVKERQERWGYEEVKRWLNNETVEIREDLLSRPDITPYILERRQIYNPKELALNVAEFWEEGKKHLYRGYFRDWVKNFGQDMASKTQDIEEEERNQDFGLFKFIYTIYPDAPLCWKGEIFADLKKFGELISKNMPVINQNYVELLNWTVLEYFLEKKSYKTELIEEVKNLSQRSKKDGETAYYLLGYLLGETSEFHFDNRSFENVDTLIDYISSQGGGGEIGRIADNLLAKKYFFAWLEHHGYGEHIENWKKISN